MGSKKKLKSSFFLIVRISISFGLLFYLFKKTDFQKIVSLLKEVNFFFYFLAFLCVAIFQSLLSYRWKSICSAWNFNKEYSFFLKTYLISFSLNTIFPGTVAGDALRTFYLTKSGLDFKKASFSVFLDRILGLTGVLFLLSLSLPLYGAFLPKKLFFSLNLIVYLSILGFFLLVLFFTFYLKRNFFQPLSLPTVLKPLALGLSVQFFFVLQFVALGRSINLQIPIGYYFVIIPLVSFLSALPLSISGLGIREGTLTYFFYLLKYPMEYGVSLGLLAYSLILLSGFPGIFLYLKGKWN